MHIYNRLRRLNKKGDVPGWAIVIGLILGLVVIIAVIYISIKGKDFLIDKMNFLKSIF